MIFLCQPLSRESGKLNYPPFGLLAAAAIPASKGRDIRILDGNVLTTKEIFTAIDRYQPDIVGITTFTGPVLKEALLISRFIKKNHECPCCVGRRPRITAPGAVYAGIMC